MEERKGFGSNFGFLMAAIGSAVGLGNIWGFPNKMGANGGFTFLIIYLILAVLCGFVVMVGELAIGRKTGKGAIAAYRSLSQRFKWVGWLGVASAFLIMSFYCALGGYCLKYVVLNIGNLTGAAFGSNGLSGSEVFSTFLTSQGEGVIYGLIFVVLTMVIVMGGVSGGIEKFCGIGMPALFFMLLICIVRACTLPGADDYEEGEKKSSVLDLLLPVIVLIGLCIVGLVWTGGMWDAESDNYHNFVMAFSDASAGVGLCLGSIIAIVFTFVYYWCRGLIGFEKSFESIPNGFIQMISPILILCFAWTLCGLCRDDGLQVGAFVESVMANTGNLAKFLPAVIFIVACFIGFATGTSWGTIGIMVPLVCAVFNWDTQIQLLSIGLAASCAGGVCGDHLSPISDTTIMASAGAHCYHLNHVATQIPYGVTVAAVSFVSFIIAGLVQNAVICMIIAIVLMVATLLVIKSIVSKKHAGIFEEMAAADKVLYNK